MGPVSVVKSAVFIATLPVRIPVVAGGAVFLGVHTFWDRNVTLSSKKTKQTKLLNESIQKLKLVVQDNHGFAKLLKHKQKKMGASIRLDQIEADIRFTKTEIESLRSDVSQNTNKLNKYKILKKSSLPVSVKGSEYLDEDDGGANAGLSSGANSSRRKSTMSRLSGVFSGFPMGLGRKGSALSKMSACSVGGGSESQSKSENLERSDRDVSANVIMKGIKRAAKINRKLVSYSKKLEHSKRELLIHESKLKKYELEKDGLGPTGDVSKLQKDVDYLKKIVTTQEARKTAASEDASVRLEELKQMSRKTRLVNKIFGGVVNIGSYEVEVLNAGVKPNWNVTYFNNWLDSRGKELLSASEQAAD